MAWWGWLLGWLVLATVAAFWLGAAAAAARRREHGWRDAREGADAAAHRSGWDVAG
jgi:hypothetical protein